MTGRFPGAGSVEQFWHNVRNGVESITFFSDDELLARGVPAAMLSNPRYVKASTLIDGVDLFDAAFFGFNPREAEVIDPQQRLFLECCWEVLERAGYDPETYKGLIGLYAGTGLNTYAYNLAGNPEVASVGGYQLMIGNDKDFLTTRVSYKLNLKGPSVVVQTACSTSLVAVYQACESLQAFRCDMALAGGVSINVHDTRGYFHQDGMILSPDGHCRAFDAKARGTVGGKGLGVVVLKRLADAIEDGDTIHAVISGWAINNDGSLKVGYTAPSVEGQAQVITEAVAMSNVPVESITYIEAHGTGTELGDPIELGALNIAFGSATDKRHFCALGSLKTNIGHLDTAAGVAGLIKAALAVEHAELPPSLHFEAPNPRIDFESSPFFVNTALRPWQTSGMPRRAGVSSFGIGGTNAHVVIEQAPVRRETSASRPYQLLTVSARTPAALDRATAQLAGHLTANPGLPLADVAYTLHVGRRAFDHRRFLVCRCGDDAAPALAGTGDARPVTGVKHRSGAACAFMFSGQGSQHVDMTRDLYENERVFREIVDECSVLLEPVLRLDMRDVLYPPAGKAEAAARVLAETRITQPALFVVEYALARLWMHWGIAPSAMIGHSIGEYVAACLADVFSLPDALAVIAARGRVMQQRPAGTMMAVQMPAGAVRELLDGTLSLAADNAPGLCVVSGETEAIGRLEATLAARGVVTRRLHTSHAFHSHMMDDALPEFRRAIEKVTLRAPRRPYVSNVTGTWITEAEATDPEYWVRHLREGVRFAEGVRALLASDAQVLLEVGPGSTLRSLALQQVTPGGSHTVLASLPHPQDTRSDMPVILETLGRLWIAGAPIAWTAFHEDERRHRVTLPTYPFERQRFWVEPQPRAQAAARTAAAGQIEKRQDVASWFYLPAWKRSIPPAPDPQASADDPGDCWVVFDDLAGVGRSVAERLTMAGRDVLRLVPGRAFAPLGTGVYSINPRHAEDYDAAIRELKALAKHPRRILHFWGVPPTASDDGDLFESGLTAGFYSLMYLAQAIGRQRLTGPIQLSVVAGPLHDIWPDDVVAPEKATVLGACVVIPQEYGNIECRTVDIGQAPAAGDIARVASLVFNEVQGGHREPVVAYRGGTRWVQRFEEAPLGPGAPSRFKDGGVYLITGGLGSVGLTLAHHLATTRKAKLVLTGRSGLPPRKDWDAVVSTYAGSRAARQIEIVRRLESAGAEVLVVAADVTDVNRMREAVVEAESRFGRLDGVVHAAGTVGGEAFTGIQQLTVEQCGSQFAAKARGLLALEEALGDRQLDVCLLTSSISCILGGLGYAAYAAANNFMDGFAASRRQTTGRPWVSLDLDGFQFGDAGKSALSGLLMSGSEGVEVIERALAVEPLTRLVVSTGDLAARIDRYVTKQPPRTATVEEAAAAAPAPAGHARPELETEYVGPADEVEETLARIWQELLGIERIGRLDDFFELGGHSLLAVQVVSRIDQAFHVELSLRNVFEARTVAQLADHIKTLVWITQGEGAQAGAEREEIEI
jgi:acyl transferase domain-containing protein